MIFKCFLCETYHFWNKKKHFTVIGQDKAGNDVVEKKVCENCGNQLNKQYEAGLAIMNMEGVEVDNE